MSTSFGRLQAALASATNEVTVAAANLNFDFTLVKYEAPKEFQPLGEMLAASKKSSAETGLAHVTARRLGALFEGVCPHTPNLMKAYGKRVSQISVAAKDKNTSTIKASLFSEYSGVDGTSIWAAATSSTAALHVHLLSCMLARIFEPAEAVSIWIELVKKRREGIALKVERSEEVPFSMAAAAVQNEIPKAQLAEWDASARAWLRTADSVKRDEYTQLRNLLKDVSIKVNDQTDVYPSVTEAWKSALQAIENLVTGVPQAVRDGAVLLGLSAWHLYPDLAVFGPQNFHVNMGDPLVNQAGVLTLGLSAPGKKSDSGVFWCLSLAHLRRYGKPVRTESRLQEDQGRINAQQFFFVALGAVLAKWNVSSSDISLAMRFILAICREISKVSTSDGNFGWNSTIAKAASGYLAATGNEAEMAYKMVQFGRRRSKSFLGDRHLTHTNGDNPIRMAEPTHFSLRDWRRLLKCLKGTEARIKFMRHKMSKLHLLRPERFIIQYRETLVHNTSSSIEVDSDGDEIMEGQVNMYSGEDHIMESQVNMYRAEDGELMPSMVTDIRQGSDYDSAEESDEADTLLGETYTSYATVAPIGASDGLLPWMSLSLGYEIDAENLPTTCNHRLLLYTWKIERLPDGEQCHFLNEGVVAAQKARIRIRDDSGEDIFLEYLCGALDSMAVFQWPTVDTDLIDAPEVEMEDILWCLEREMVSGAELCDVLRSYNEELCDLFNSLKLVDEVYQNLPDATISLKVFDKEFQSLQWGSEVYNRQSRPNWLTRRRSLSLVAFLDSGTCDVSPANLDNVMAVSSGDSIYVPKQVSPRDSTLIQQYSLLASSCVIHGSSSKTINYSVFWATLANQASCSLLQSKSR